MGNGAEERGRYVGILEGSLGCGEGGGEGRKGRGGGEGEGVGGMESGKVWDGEGSGRGVFEEMWVGLGTDG